MKALALPPQRITKSPQRATVAENRLDPSFPSNDPAVPVRAAVRPTVIDAYDDEIRYRDDFTGWQTIPCYVQRYSDGWEVLTTVVDGYSVRVWMRGKDRAVWVKSGHHDWGYYQTPSRCECTLWGKRGWCNHHPIGPKALRMGEAWQFAQRQQARRDWAACDEKAVA